MSSVEKHGPGFRGVYRDAEGRRHRTRTVASRREARRAAQDQEAKVRAGSWLDPSLGRMTLRDYVVERWLPNRGGELNTRASYHSHWRAVEPRFGSTELRRILPSTVQSWVTEMTDAGVSPGTIRARVVFLQTVLAAKRGTSALRDGLIERNPCWGVSLPTVRTREVQIYEPEEYERLVASLHPYWEPLVVFAAETGLRWGELMGLRLVDFDAGLVAVHARRTIVQTGKTQSGNGTPFAWKEYPKGKRPRRIALTPEATKLAERVVAEQNLAPVDRIFSMGTFPTPRRVKVVLDDQLLARMDAFEAPNGLSYRHGTVNAYQTGKCRCCYCRQAASDYRYARLQTEAKTAVPKHVRTAEWPEGLPVDRTYFRERVWLPAIAQAEVPVRRFHDLRASHISWLLGMGVDLPTVMERVGHREFETTMRYTRSLSGADEKVLMAMRRVRRTAEE